MTRPTRTQPLAAPSTQPVRASAERAEIERILAQLEVKPEYEVDVTSKCDVWSQHGRYGGDARYYDGERWQSFTAQGMRSQREVEQTLLDVVRARAGGML